MKIGDQVAYAHHDTKYQWDWDYARVVSIGEDVVCLMNPNTALGEPPILFWPKDAVFEDDHHATEYVIQKNEP